MRATARASERGRETAQAWITRLPDYAITRYDRNVSLRIGFDVDGVLADFAAAYHECESRIFGRGRLITRAGDPEREPVVDVDANADPVRNRRGEKDIPHPAELRRRRDVVWQAIEETPDFWTTLSPLSTGAVGRLHSLMLAHQWEVFFITQRPATRGDTVQRQTQRWLVEQGFDLPSVLVIPGSRGAAAGALRLDYHVDDSPENCMDVKSESTAKPLLIVDSADDTTVMTARTLGIGTASGIEECLDILEQASIARAQPSLLDRLAKLVGWF